MAIVIKIARRLIALTAAYAVALQASLAGVAMPAAAAAPEICTTAGHGPVPDSVPMGPDCAACPALCGSAGPDGVAPGALAIAAPPVLSLRIDGGCAAAAPGLGQRRLPPSRAPPAA